jgi:ribosomal protein L29
MKRIDTNNKSRGELQASLRELHTKLTQLSFDQGDKKLKDSSQLKKTKKDIARLLTAYNANK